MKKIKIIIVAIIGIFILKTNVYAVSANLSVSTTSIDKGGSFTATVNINGAAAWNVHVSATGPVAECSINEVDTSSNALNTSKTFTTTCITTGEGSKAAGTDR